ncbi:hypothetical protein BZG36_00103 [Bifiguratus adelaidae]|uniref:Uncharacterized protein n=1 Tax=Bifiguratus adelaidae TaxID=1938954 RepID=A0A261Y853_9FUNG|nr:hypothetical protein BZG36_00103 [Bifiguratus adelaidae]
MRAMSLAGIEEPPPGSKAGAVLTPSPQSAEPAKKATPKRRTQTKTKSSTPDVKTETPAKPLSAKAVAPSSLEDTLMSAPTSAKPSTSTSLVDRVDAALPQKRKVTPSHVVQPDPFVDDVPVREAKRIKSSEHDTSRSTSQLNQLKSAIDDLLPEEDVFERRRRRRSPKLKRDTSKSSSHASPDLLRHG